MHKNQKQMILEYFIHGVREKMSCIACETLRLDPDPTGLTCGQPGCLLSLFDIYEERGDEMRTIAEMAGVDKRIAENEKLHYLFYYIQDELKQLLEGLDELARNLEIKRNNLNKNPTDLVIEIIQKLKETSKTPDDSKTSD